MLLVFIWTGPREGWGTRAAYKANKILVLGFLDI